jgi:LPPG:FO 2-phospho-L-lactate transferase
VSGPVVVLAGGTGGAKLARGMLDVAGAESLVVIANSGDDIEIHGAYVSPDPDLVTFWLTDRIDERGWGLAGDTFHVMEGLKEIDVEVWFNLGDKDLAIGLERARRLQRGERLTTAHAAIAEALNAPATVLPMCDEPVRTRVMANNRWWPFQEYMIKAGGAAAKTGPVQDVEFRGARNARPTPEVLNAIATASAIVIGPSNPIISIGPILAVNGMREALTEARAPVVAVSPLVGGEVVKGPTAAFMEFTELDGLVSDQRAEQIPVLETDVLLATPETRRRVAEETLNFALALG